MGQRGGGPDYVCEAVTGASYVQRKQEQECYLCGNPADTKDHIPPRCIFPDPKPTDLITVPSCQECNSASQLDDEYFRWFVATASSEHPEALRLIRERVIPRFRKRPALLKSIMRRAVRVNVHSRAGVFLKQRPGFHFDRPRIQNVVEKITKGLYRHETAQRLANEYSVKDFVFNPDVPDSAKDWVISLPLREIGAGLFSYRYAQAFEDEGVTTWFLVFFDKTMIMSMTDVQ